MRAKVTTGRPVRIPPDKRGRVHALIAAGRFDEAWAQLDSSCRQFPDDPEVWFLLAAVSGARGDFSEAIRCAERSLVLDPRNSDGWFNLGQARMKQGDVRGAVAAYREALKFRPDNVELLNNLGFALQKLGEFREAVEHHRRALQLAPRSTDVLNNFGLGLCNLGNHVAAKKAFCDALAIDPSCHSACLNLSNALHETGDSAGALAALDRALRIKPDYVEAMIGQGLVNNELGNADAAAAAFRWAIESEPGSRRAHAGHLFCMNYHESDPRALFDAHVAWGRTLEASLPAFGKYPAACNPNRRIRVGYVSPDFRTHSVAFFAEPLLAHHDREIFEIYCYADVRQPDQTTSRLREYADVWREITAMTDEEVAKLVHQDAIDILVDLAGYTVAHQLPVFARKPAPIQGAWLGYPNTTGLRRVDFRMTDAQADPPGESDSFHTESLERLPNGFLCYRAPDEAPPVMQRVRGRATNVVFGSFNNLSKVSPATIAAWARILAAVPSSRLLLKNSVLADSAASTRFSALFADYGIESTRLIFRPWTPARGPHLAQYAEMDIALDTFPYNGTTTTCEALWMGVPVVTQAGLPHASRVGASILTQVGLADLVADSLDRYVEIAVELARCPERLDSLRAQLRERVNGSALCDGAGFARDVEAVYRRRWQRYCHEAGPSP